MADLADEIRKQEEAIHMKINPQKLAETRLENRTERPNHELSLDAPFYGLCDEASVCHFDLAFFSLIYTFLR